MFGREYRVEGFSTGCIPNRPDKRDANYSIDKLAFATSDLPLQAGFKPYEVPEQLNQKSTPHCVAFSVAHVFGILEELAGLDYQKVSTRQFHYNMRLLRGREKQNTGASIRDAGKVSTRVGICDEEYCKFSTNTLVITKAPKAFCVLRGHKRSGGAYYHILETDMDQRMLAVRAALAAPGKKKRPVVFGAAIGRSFAQAKGVEIAPFLQMTEMPVGNHAMVIIAYRYVEGRGYEYLVLNSWSLEWGINGVIWVPEGSFQDYNSFDYTVLHGWKCVQEALS